VIVLDTHVWVWLSSQIDDLLSPVALRAIDSASEIGIPAVCCLEIAQHEKRGRLELDRDIRSWFEQSLTTERVRLLPLTPEIAIGAARLLWDHRDPFDRVIVATAIVHRAPLVTKDDRIRRFQGVATIW
jgi:PIN domain nuclease of toxin-antitoxin system